MSRYHEIRAALETRITLTAKQADALLVLLDAQLKLTPSVSLHSIQLKLMKACRTLDLAAGRAATKENEPPA